MYWILLLFLILGVFFPVIGWVAVLCMVGPVLMSVFRGRYWCGHICPRGNFYDRVVARWSLCKPVPAFLRSRGCRAFMVVLIFVVFSVQIYGARGDAQAMGGVFLQIVFLTTLAGIVLGIGYRPRAWCGICPMGTLSAWVAPKPKAAPKTALRRIVVDETCVGCGLCAEACPMQLRPYTAKSMAEGFLNGDCFKCGACVEKCPKQALRLK